MNIADLDFMKAAREAATASHCMHSNARVGVVAVRDGQIIASAANQTVGNIQPCTTAGRCLRQDLNIPSGTKREVAHCICAEQRMICNAARDGIALDGAEVYVTTLPCKLCVRLLTACGITRVVYDKSYPGESLELATATGLKLVPLK